MAVKILRDGVSIPRLGLGMWQCSKAKDVVLTAIECGYRMFDCATMYENEFELGEALRTSELKREEYFVVTKLSLGHGYNEAKKELNGSLKKLGLSYVDLYLIHSPSGGRNVETWKALVDLKTEGKVRSIGVSNFNVHHLEGLASAGLPVPAVNQIELHPWLQQRKVVEYCQRNDIGLMAFCPLARCRRFSDCKLLKQLSVKYSKSMAQILNRWSVQKDFICIPKSDKMERQKENLDIFDFSISEDDMSQLDSLDCDMRVSNHTIKLPWEG